ncbi:hypothetical protein [Bradyrhizobium paxllaeri]|uniref:hypothetical protein n=1 Tax=Bradyrhizobium paxllaeri TaxID=190148 RepID=UPI0008286036|nr:hypothetical protein [Bradyrhizobium paxllaeri]
MVREHSEVNFYLEMINGTSVILIAVLLAFLVTYIKAELHRRDLSWRDLFDYPAGLSLALSITVAAFGFALTRGSLWVWRQFGSGEQMSEWQLHLALIGSAITSLGILWMIRVLSRPRFGDWPWIAAGSATLLYAAINAVGHYGFS